jgi:hypothetical protein
MALTKVTYSMVQGAPTNVFDFMTPAQIADIQTNTGSVDVTTAIQTALDASQNVYLPAGTYLTSAMLKLHDNQSFYGAGSTVSLIKNESTDCIGKDDSPSTDNYFEVKGIGCTKTFSLTSTTKAFNFTNSTYITCEDLAATNFYCGIYLARSTTNFGSTNACWYNVFKKLVFRECAFVVFIDNNNGALPDVNGCFFDGMIFTNLTYSWASNSVVTGGIKYSGYGHVFRDGYIQGFSHHVWRTTGFGENTFEGLYIESELIAGEAVYLPTAYAGNKDLWIGGHFDTFTVDPFYDPFNTLTVLKPTELRNFPAQQTIKIIPAGATQTLTVTLTGYTGQFQIVAEAGGFGAAGTNITVQGVLSSSSYYSLVETGDFDNLALSMAAAVKGNGSFTISITNSHTSSANVRVVGSSDSAYSVALA